MESTKKIYILIGILVLAVSAVFLALFFTNSSSDEEKPKTSLCPEHITYQKVVYRVVEIDGKCWLADNLRATSYRDGTTIPSLKGSDEWEKDKEGSYSCYYNQENYCQEYGALYSWYAVSNERGLCPEGWSVPTQEQWTDLERVVCQDLGYQDCQERFPSGFVSGWQGTNEGLHLRAVALGGKDSYGFKALFGGFRNSAGPFDFLGERGFWWTSVSSSGDFAYARVLDKNKQGIRYVESSRSSGFSVRCVKDL